MQMTGVTLRWVNKFKYLGIEFLCYGRGEGEIERRVAAAGAAFHSLHLPIIKKKELSLQSKIAVFKTIYRPILTYGCENWVNNESMRSRVQAGF